ncbi:MAG: inorganic diphosphatase [Alphaproteobacteria bacterium]
MPLRINKPFDKIAPINDDDTINAIVEIPTGTLAKWEMDKENTDQVMWEFKKGKPRVVQYLGYPGNYGAIPQTNLPKELGGDGDPLDVLVLGQAAPRGEVIPMRLIGVMKMLDDGEQDDKLIGVLTKASPFSDIQSIEELEENFKGITEILKIWFHNYKGADGNIEVLGFENRQVAMEILNESIKNFK